MKIISFFLFLSVSITINAQTSFTVSFPAKIVNESFDGRLILMLSKNNKEEPRFQIADGPSSQLAFGMDVENWKAGTVRTFTSNFFGYPIESLKDVPKGEYYVQALLHKYETFHRKDGHVVKLPMDRGEGQQWNQAPGNIYSKPLKIKFDPNSKTTVRILLEQEIPPIKEPDDTRYIKNIKIQSKLLTEFWGRPMFIGAHILLPEGWDTHPGVKYPLAIYHGHFPADFGGFRTIPPDTSLISY